MIKRGLEFYLQPQPATRVRRPPATQNHQVTASTQTQVDELASPTASTSLGGVEEDMIEEKDPPEVPASPAPVAAMNAQKSTATQSITGSSKPTTSNEEAVAIDTASSPVKEEAKNPPGQDAVLEESIQVTRGRLRRTCTSISDNMFCGAVSFLFSTSIKPTLATSRHLEGFFPHFHFPFGGSSRPANGTSSFPRFHFPGSSRPANGTASRFHFPSFPFFHFPNRARNNYPGTASPASSGTPPATPSENTHTAPAPDSTSTSPGTPAETPSKNSPPAPDSASTAPAPAHANAHAHE
ncbi:hypothetical protein POM88_035530 [Heracleum sosnowskyi]|uniref:Uncharacterized protein n=1 Tax=Heracleum sosnowskyi TaxID=360622 RepID=A0AAD8MES6_9APIA|nr:hypothetical protein POM88_035530 [Heracleum sosnowskyi]